ncbi:MAG: OmpA family protein [Bacteroidota bacterium]
MSVLLFIQTTAFGQSKEIAGNATQGDFETAEEILDSVVRITDVHIGSGNHFDFHESKVFYESHSSWFKFYIRKDTLLTFDIIPEDAAENYDFTLFRCVGKNCKDELKSKDFEPVRKSFFATNGAVGLSRYATFKNKPNGKRPGYAEALPVKAGELYYLIINLRKHGQESLLPEERTPYKGYTIYFYNYWPERLAYLKAQKVASQPIVLANVLFKNNTTELLPKSNHALNDLVKKLQGNKTMTIEVIGHTDPIGDHKKNQELSEGRAKAVVEYLVSKGIAINRLSYKGLGSTKPLATNNTEEGRTKNRRVEFRIIEK